MPSTVAPPHGARLASRRRLLHDLDASGARPMTLEVIALRPGEELSAIWLLEDDPTVPRQMTAAVRAAAIAHGAVAYDIDRLLYAVLGPATQERSVASEVRTDIERALPGTTRVVLHATASLPVEAKGRAALGLCLDRLERRSRRQSGSTERQVRDVLLRLLSERRAGRLGGRAVRVSEFAVTVGRKMGLGLEELDVLLRAAELQDVGKAMLSDTILDKRAGLSPDEWQMVRGHPLVAEHILDGAPGLRPVALLARSCAERFDGGGYPDGLKGDEIPLGARIIAVCVAFDAMTADRAWRPALPVSKAIAELYGASGEQFDPEVVTAFCAGLANDGDPAFPSRSPALPLDDAVALTVS